jgi:hypothetical protein
MSASTPREETVPLKLSYDSEERRGRSTKVNNTGTVLKTPEDYSRSRSRTRVEPETRRERSKSSDRGEVNSITTEQMIHKLYKAFQKSGEIPVRLDKDWEKRCAVETLQRQVDKLTEQSSRCQYDNESDYMADLDREAETERQIAGINRAYDNGRDYNDDSLARNRRNARHDSSTQFSNRPLGGNSTRDSLDYIPYGNNRKDDITFKREFWGNAKEKVDWIAYRQHFLDVKKANDWSDDKARRRLKLQLRADAEMYMQSQEMCDIDTLDKFLDKMDERFGPFVSRATYIAEAEMRTKKPEESFRTMGQDIETLCRKAFPGEQGSVKTMSMKFFMDNCSDDFKHREHVRASNPESLWKAVEAATYYKKVCLDLEKQRVPRTKGTHAVTTDTAHQKFQSGNSKTDNMECFTCHRLGHMSRECPDNKGQRHNSRPGNQNNNKPLNNGTNNARTGHNDNQGSKRRDPNPNCLNCGRDNHQCRECREPIRPELQAWFDKVGLAKRKDGPRESCGPPPLVNKGAGRGRGSVPNAPIPQAPGQGN